MSCCWTWGLGGGEEGGVIEVLDMSSTYLLRGSISPCLEPRWPAHWQLVLHLGGWVVCVGMGGE